MSASCMQVREFVEEQYKATGLQLHQEWSPVEVKQQEDGRLTLVIEHKEDGRREEIKDNDQVGRYRRSRC